MKNCTFYVYLKNDKNVARMFINSTSIAGVIRHIQRDESLDMFKISDIETIYKLQKVTKNFGSVMELE